MGNADQQVVATIPIEVAGVCNGSQTVVRRRIYDLRRRLGPVNGNSGVHRRVSATALVGLSYETLIHPAPSKRKK
jgi:hypothetical protein